ncbi:MAG: hypothetical protein V4812_19150 [Pseudomonadota bacterium]
MTTHATPDTPEAVSPDTTNSAESLASSTPAEKAGIPAFSFPFSPGTFAPGKSEDQPWHQKGNKSAHHKTPGRAPNGTRRSMGKR